MLFAVDVGNSHTVSGIYEKGQLVGNWRLQSRQDRTADELAIRYHGLFQMAGIDPERIGIKATTTERMGFTGRREGIAAMASASVLLPCDTGA